MKIFTLLLFTFSFSFATSGQRIKNEKMIIEKWTKATINILGYPELSRNYLSKLDHALVSGQIDSTRYRGFIAELIMSEKTGTAIWIEYESYNFLISARHVFEDKTNCTGCCYKEIIIVESDTKGLVDLHMYHKDANRNYVFEIGNPIDMVIVDNPKLYKFSRPEDDLAIVNLDSAYYAFGLFPFLKLCGYKPINIEDIDTDFSVKEGNSVFAIGYLSDLAKIKSDNEIPSDYALMTSPLYSFPIVSHGRVSNIRRGQNNFLVDIFIYHGFSGGPIINSNGKLIGITHGAHMPKVKLGEKSYSDFNGKFIKSSLILPLLKDLLVQVKSEKFNRMVIISADNKK